MRVRSGRSNRIGSLAGVKSSPEGQMFSEVEWATPQDEWLPSASDRTFVQSPIGRVTEPGRFANWIAPPMMGIHRQPVDFEHVRIS